jgi:hypothetical protein
MGREFCGVRSRVYPEMRGLEFCEVMRLKLAWGWGDFAMGVGRCRPAGLVQAILNWCIACSRQLSVQLPCCGSQPVGRAADRSDVATWRRGHGVNAVFFLRGRGDSYAVQGALKKSLLSLSQAWTKCNEYVRGIRTEPESAVDSERNAVQECGGAEVSKNAR